jgi:hypothetical protein
VLHSIAEFTVNGIDLYQIIDGKTRYLAVDDKRKLHASIVTAYRTGYSIRSVAALTNTSYGYVHACLVRNRVRRRRQTHRQS